MATCKTRRPIIKWLLVAQVHPLTSEISKFVKDSTYRTSSSKIMSHNHFTIELRIIVNKYIKHTPITEQKNFHGNSLKRA